MKEIISIFVILIALFSVVGFMPVCEDCDIFAIDLQKLNNNKECDGNLTDSCGRGSCSNHEEKEYKYRNKKNKHSKNNSECNDCQSKDGDCSDQKKHGGCGEMNQGCSGNSCGEKVETTKQLHCRESVRGTCGTTSVTNNKELITIADIRKDSQSFDEKQVFLKVKEGIRPGDGESLEQLSTRSDCYVHDGTGTMVLRGGWQYKNAYMQAVKDDPDYVFIDENIKIEKGVWEISPYVYSRYSKTILTLKKFD